MTLTIPEKEWIKKTFEYKRVYEKGKRLYSKYIILFALNNSLDYSRVGISVGKKIGNSVKRNRIKRLIREILRHTWKEVVTGKDMVIVVKREAVGKGIEELRLDIDAIFTKAELLKKKKNM